MKELHDDIANNWTMIDDQSEKNILHKYSERGRKLTIFYASEFDIIIIHLPYSAEIIDVTYYYIIYISALMTLAAIIINVFPFISKILDQAIPLENPRPNMYITGGVYFVDRTTDENFALLVIFDSITVILIIIISVSVDTMFMASTEHCCALYAIVGWERKNTDAFISR